MSESKQEASTNCGRAYMEAKRAPKDSGYIEYRPWMLEGQEFLAKAYKPQPEGQDAQPKWCGRKVSADEQRYQTDPAFEDWEGIGR